MTRLVASLALALSLACSSAVVLAAPGKANVARHEKHAELAKKFPMKADDFRQLVSERTAKARERMEKAISKRQVPSDKANEIRAKFAAVQAQVDAKTAEVCADGTVTLEEAKQVLAIVREAAPHHGKKDHGKKGDRKLPGRCGAGRAALCGANVDLHRLAELF